MFTVTITANVAENERGVFATQQMEQVALAEKYAAVESHGVDGAVWEITAALPLKKAKSLVMASRNRKIALYVRGGPAIEGTSGYLDLKAPGTCAALDVLYHKEADGARVPVVITPTHLFVG